MPKKFQGTITDHELNALAIKQAREHKKEEADKDKEAFYKQKKAAKHARWLNAEPERKLKKEKEEADYIARLNAIYECNQAEERRVAETTTSDELLLQDIAERQQLGTALANLADAIERGEFTQVHP